MHEFDYKDEDFSLLKLTKSTMVVEFEEREVVR